MDDQPNETSGEWIEVSEDRDALDLFRLAEEARRARLEDERLDSRRAHEVELNAPDIEDSLSAGLVSGEDQVPAEVASAVLRLGAAGDRLVTVMAEYADEPSISSTTTRHVVNTMAETVIAVLDASAHPHDAEARDDRDVLPDPMLRRGRLLDLAERHGLRYPTAVCAAMGAAAAAAVAVAFGRFTLGLVCLMVFAAFDSLDGGLARRDPRATTLGIYAACLASHLDDLLLIGGLSWWSYFREPGLTVGLLTATCVSLYASLARTFVLQFGIRLRWTWLERVSPVVGVGLALVTKNLWPAILLLALSGVTELVILGSRIRHQHVQKVLAFVLKGPRDTNPALPPQEQPGEWTHIVRRGGSAYARPWRSSDRTT